MDKEILAVIIGMSVVTYIPRMLPTIVLSKINIPEVFLKWLGYVPVAVLSALLAPALLMEGKQVNIGFDNKYLFASIPCFVVAAKTRNLFYTVFTGLISIIVVNFII